MKRQHHDVVGVVNTKKNTKSTSTWELTNKSKKKELTIYCSDATKYIKHIKQDT